MNHTGEALTADRHSQCQRTVPGDIHIWVMVLGDLIIFGAYFVIFMIYRAMTPDVFLASQQHLDVTIGVINTLVLLTSSWFVAQGVWSTRCGDYVGGLRMTLLGGFCGTVFIAIKAYEWSVKIASGFTFSTNEFFSFYYMLTGVHLFHVGVGLIILGVVAHELRDPRRRRAAVIESGGIYWHMVDLLWVVIFAIFYVLR